MAMIQNWLGGAHPLPLPTLGLCCCRTGTYCSVLAFASKQGMSAQGRPVDCTSHAGLTGGGGGGTATGVATGAGGGSGEARGGGDNGSESAGTVRPSRVARSGAPFTTEDATALAPAPAGDAMKRNGGEGAGVLAPEEAAAGDGSAPPAAAGKPFPAAARNWTKVWTLPAGAPTAMAPLPQARARTGSE